MSDLGTMALRLAEGTGGIGEIAEKVARLVFELGRAITQALYAYLDLRFLKKKRRRKGLRHIGMRERSVLTRFEVPGASGKKINYNFSVFSSYQDRLRYCLMAVSEFREGDGR